MSADYVVVFYVAQVALSAFEVRACESGSHPLMNLARHSRLDTYWADFTSDDGHGFQLLVGRRFGTFGLEDSVEAHIEKGTGSSHDSGSGRILGVRWSSRSRKVDSSVSPRSMKETNRQNRRSHLTRLLRGRRRASRRRG